MSCRDRERGTDTYDIMARYIEQEKKDENFSVVVHTRKNGKAKWAGQNSSLSAMNSSRKGSRYQPEHEKDRQKSNRMPQGRSEGRGRRKERKQRAKDLDVLNGSGQAAYDIIYTCLFMTSPVLLQQALC